MYLLAVCTILLVFTCQVGLAGNTLRPPMLIRNGEGGTLLEGRTYILFCTFSGIPQPAVTWKKNGFVIRVARNEFYSTYTISGATLSDTGEYMCEGENSQGTASGTITVTVLQAATVPTIHPTTTEVNIKGTRQTQTPPVGPNNLETTISISEPGYYYNNFKSVVFVEAGSTLRLYCEVISSQHYGITWYRNGQQVQTGSSYTTRSSNQNDVGSYQCIATDGVNSDGSSVEVRLGSPLTITSSPPCSYYTLRDSVSLTVTLSRQFGYEVSWFRVEESSGSRSLIKIQPENGVIFQSNSRRIDIISLTSEYSGEYVVRVESQWEERDSDTFCINVYADITTPQVSGTTPYVEGSTIELPCAYIGFPEPVVTWWKNNVEIDTSNSNKYNLISDNTMRAGPLDETDDGDVIKCYVIQNNGYNTLIYTLEMGTAPEMITTNCDANICSGSNLRLECEAESDSALTYYWYRESDTTPLTTSSKYNKYSSGRLDIRNPNSNDIGVYYCEARNSYGSVIKRCTVNTNTVVSFTTNPQNLILTLGRSINIYCRVIGSLGATVSWYKDDSIAVPSDYVTTTRSGHIIRSILSLTSVTTGHDGAYTCRVTSCGEDLEQTNQLRVRENVAITVVPDTVDFCSGNTVSFPCEATGFPTPEINWYFNDVSILSGEDGFEIDSQNTLRVIEGPADKTGDYICNASNPYSWRTYRFRALFQETELPAFSDTSPLQPILNEDFCLSCQPVVANVDYTYEWYKQNSLLSNSAKYDQNNEWQLCISNFSPQDLGRYSCKVTNCVGSSRKYFNIYSHQNQDTAPSITTTRAVYNVIEDRNVRLFCNVTGSPTPSISWYYGDEQLSEDSYISFAELPHLLITNIQRHLHNGNYECIATNRVGSDSLSIQLTVYQPPRLDTNNQIHQNVDVGSTACLVCRLLQGYPTPTVSWTKDSVELTYEGRMSINQDNTLCISGVVGADQGTYRCTVTNQVGWAYVQGLLQVRTCGQLRYETITLNHTVVEGNSLILNCPIQPNVFECSVITVWKEVTLGTNAVLTDIQSSDPRVSGDDITLQIDINSTGLYQCITYNDYRTIAQYHSVIVVSPPRKVPFLKEQIYRVNSEVNLNCPIHGVPRPSYVWLLEGAELSSGDNLIVNEGHITINNATASNTGKYNCSGSNLYGRIEVMIELTICEPMSIEMTGDHVVEERDRTVFECSLNSEIIADSIEFLVGIQRTAVADLPSNRFSYGFTGENSAQLMIWARVEDTGPVTCRINTTCGTSVRTHLLTVEARENDRIRVVKNQITHPGTVTPNCHNQFTLTCPVRGRPKPTYTWYHNNTRIKFNRHSNVASARGRKEITIHDPDINDAGRYRCNATNVHARISYTYIVPIQLPNTYAGSESHMVFEGEQVNLACNSSLVANRKWSKNLETIPTPTSDDNDLVINQVEDSDEGVYLCCARSGEKIYKYIHEIIIL